MARGGVPSRSERAGVSGAAAVLPGTPRRRGLAAALSSERGRERGARLAARLSYEEAALLCARPAGPRLLAPRQPGGRVRTATRPGHGHARPPVRALTRWAGQTQKPPGPLVCSSDSVEGIPGCRFNLQTGEDGNGGKCQPAKCQPARKPGGRALRQGPRSGMEGIPADGPRKGRESVPAVPSVSPKTELAWGAGTAWLGGLIPPASSQ